MADLQSKGADKLSVLDRDVQSEPLKWFGHALGWIILSVIAGTYLSGHIAIAIALLGIVVTAHVKRAYQPTFAETTRAAVKHSVRVGLVGVGIFVLGLYAWSRPADAALVLGGALGLEVAIALAIGIACFYILTWITQQALAKPQPIRSMPFVVLAVVLVMAAVQTRDRVIHSPEKLRANATEMCARGEAPPPDHEHPLLSTCAAHPGEIQAVRFTKDGQFLVSVGAGGYRVWSLTDRSLIAAIPGERVGPLTKAILLSPDEQRLLTTTGGEEDSLTVWDLVRALPAAQFRTGAGDKVTPLGFSANGRAVLAFSRQEGLIVWDLASRQRTLSQALSRVDWCDATPSPSLRFTALACWNFDRRQEDAQFAIWDSEANTIVLLKLPQTYGVEFSDDERVMGVSTGGRPTDFAFYETTNWGVVTLPPDATRLLSMRIEVSRGYGELFWLPDPKPGRTGYRINAYKVALSLDGNLKAVYVEGPYNLRLVDMQTNQGTDLCPPGCYGGSPILHGLVMSPDRHWLAAIYGGGISLWDLRTRQLMTSLHGLPPQKAPVAKAPPSAQVLLPPRQTLAEQCDKDVAEACYEEGLTTRNSGKFTEAELLLEKACRLRGSYCVELAKVSAKEGNQAGELRWLKAACHQQERQGCQQWMYAAERAKDEAGIREALFGRCRIDGEYCPSLLASADKAGTTTKLIDEVCHATLNGCAAIGKSLENVHRLVHAAQAYQRACARGHAHACERKDEVALQRRKSP